MDVSRKTEEILEPPPIACAVQTGCVSHKMHSIGVRIFGSSRTFGRIHRARCFLSTAAASEAQLMRLSGVDEGIAVITLNRPAAKNALGRQMLRELQHALAEVTTDSNVRTVIVRSSVAGVFCAGADLKERAGMTPSEAESFVNSLRATFSSIGELPPPTIACIEGAALGGGLEMALACDFRVVGGDATLGLPETGLAIIPGAGGTQRLPRLVGQEKAKELVFTAAKLKGEEAMKYGLVTRLTSAGAAYEGALTLARTILPQGPLAVRAAKRAIQGGAHLDMEQGMKVEQAAYATILGSQDRLEGLAAFREKRRPVYKGI